MSLFLLLLLWTYLITCNSRVHQDVQYYMDDYYIDYKDHDYSADEDISFYYEDEMNQEGVLKWLKGVGNKIIEPFQKDWTKFVQKAVNEASKQHNKDPVTTEEIPFPRKAKKGIFDHNRITKCVRVQEFDDELKILRYDEDRDKLPSAGLLGYFQHKLDIKGWIYTFASTGPHLPVDDKLIKENPSKYAFKHPIKPPNAFNYGRDYYSQYPEPNIKYKVKCSSSVDSVSDI